MRANELRPKFAQTFESEYFEGGVDSGCGYHGGDGMVESGIIEGYTTTLHRPFLTDHRQCEKVRLVVLCEFSLFGTTRPTPEIAPDRPKVYTPDAFYRGGWLRGVARACLEAPRRVCADSDILHTSSSNQLPLRSDIYAAAVRFTWLGHPAMRIIFSSIVRLRFTRRPGRTPPMALDTSAGIAGRTPLPLPPPPPPSVFPLGRVSSSRCS